MERYRNNGRPVRGVADDFDEDSQSHIPKSRSSQQLHRNNFWSRPLQAPTRPTSRKKRKTEDENDLAQLQAPSTNDPHPSTQQSTDPPRPRGFKHTLERAKPLAESQVTISRKIVELEAAGTSIISWNVTNPRPSEKQLRPPGLQLDLLEVGADVVPFLDDDQLLYGWLTSKTAHGISVELGALYQFG